MSVENTRVAYPRTNALSALIMAIPADHAYFADGISKQGTPRVERAQRAIIAWFPGPCGLRRWTNVDGDTMVPPSRFG